MNRDALGPAFIAVVCALAVVLAAATLSDPVQQTGQSGVGSGGSEGIGGSEGESVDLGGRNESPDGLADLGDRGSLFASWNFCIPELREPPVILGIVLALAGLAYIVKRRLDTLSAVGVTTSAAIPVWLLWLLFSRCNRGSGSQGMPTMLSGRSTGGGGSGGQADPNNVLPATDLPVALLVVLGVALLAVVAVVLSDRDVFSAGLSPSLPSFRSENESEEDQAPVFGSEPAAVGRAAGRAADRIEDDADVENEVYRAWVEMTRHLDVEHPQSSTPAEFATAAVEAGMGPEDVDELTGLFEEVRYGGRSADEDRESRAVAALRRIESSYAGDGDGREA